MWLGLGEALLNLVVSVILVVWYRNVVVVAVGSLVATSIFGWFFLWPWAAREAGLPGWQLAGRVLGPTWLACVPLLLLIGLERGIPWLAVGNNVLLLGLEGCLALLMAAWGLWRLALTGLEREKLADMLGKRLARRTPA